MLRHLLNCDKRLRQRCEEMRRNRCQQCRGTGLKWGWWTYLITAPVEMLLELLLMLLPWLVLALLLVIGVAVYADHFEFLFYGLVIGLSIPTIWYSTRLVMPRCSACNGKGYHPSTH